MSMHSNPGKIFK